MHAYFNREIINCVPSPSFLLLYELPSLQEQYPCSQLCDLCFLCLELEPLLLDLFVGYTLM